MRSRRIASPGALAVAALVAACAPAAPAAAPLAPAGPPPPAAQPVLAVLTPTPTPAPVVVLDPGHNGGNGQHVREIDRLVPDGRGGTKACNSTGTETDAGYPEHAFAFDVALRAQARLRAAGLTVVLTRPDDTGVGPCVDERGHAGERSGAAAVVSIHADGAGPRDSGFHVALSEPPLAPAQAAPAHALGVDLRDALRAAGFRDSDYTGHDGISPRTDLAGLNLATRPTALVECGNMRNAAEARVLTSPEGRERYASAIARAVLAFLGRTG